MTATVTILNPSMIAHLGGCADIEREMRKPKFNDDRRTDHTAETLVEAIRLADAGMASWFVETAYTESSRDNGCWLVATTKIAPCLRKALKAAGITFDAVTGEPVTAETAAASLAALASAIAAPAVATKVCTTCSETKPVEQFTVRASEKDGRRSFCRSCAAVKRAARKAAK